MSTASKKLGWSLWTGLSGFGYGSCDHGNEPLRSTTARNFLTKWKTISFWIRAHPYHQAQDITLLPSLWESVLVISEHARLIVIPNHRIELWLMPGVHQILPCKHQRFLLQYYYINITTVYLIIIIIHSILIVQWWGYSAHCAAILHLMCCDVYYGSTLLMHFSSSGSTNTQVGVLFVGHQ
jgi:hypothetical protein